ncbi:MAG: GerMN domain-containing protein [Desulfuromonadales bacterium]|nr:GerMN domain-containing protein [Desulfuromonadales bacterium]
MKRKRSRKQGFWVVVLAFILLAIIIGVLLFNKYRYATLPPKTPVPQHQTEKIMVTLFFASEDGNSLVREGREIDRCSDISDCATDIVSELITGPVGDLQPVLPDSGGINSVHVDGNVAKVDLAQSMVDGLPGGSSSETMAVYAIVDSIAANYPQIKYVLFTVDGKPLETLKGHIDLRSPIPPDFSFENKNEGKPSQQEESDKE